jgi:hypothetical protein
LYSVLALAVYSFYLLTLPCPYTPDTPAFALVSCCCEDYGTGLAGAQPWSENQEAPRGRQEWTIIEQFYCAFMQRLDSRDKIAGRLQSAGVKLRRSRKAAPGGSARPDRAPTRTRLGLASKGLAIMNFL